MTGVRAELGGTAPLYLGPRISRGTHEASQDTEVSLEMATMVEDPSTGPQEKLPQSIQTLNSPSRFPSSPYRRGPSHVSPSPPASPAGLAFGGVRAALDLGPSKTLARGVRPGNTLDRQTDTHHWSPFGAAVARNLMQCGVISWSRAHNSYSLTSVSSALPCSVRPTASRSC
jgi:hypothetical protein